MATRKIRGDIIINREKGFSGRLTYLQHVLRVNWKVFGEKTVVFLGYYCFVGLHASIAQICLALGV